MLMVTPRIIILEEEEERLGIPTGRPEPLIRRPASGRATATIPLPNATGRRGTLPPAAFLHSTRDPG